MTLTAFEHFTHFETHHCVTGSMRHIYAYNNFAISEEMLLGLGEGIGFIYWHQKGQPPFMGGRAMPAPSAEQLAGRRTGVEVVLNTTSSSRKAESTLLDMLSNHIPVMLQVDMGFLPYFDFGGQEYHFGGHVIVACGYDAASGQVLIADRDRDLHPVPLSDLAKARGSKFKPFPPKNLWYTFDFSHKRPPMIHEIYEAIEHQTALMLNPPISNLGVKGIRKAAELVPTWGDTQRGDALKWALFNAYIFTSAVGGTGGGAFRYMFSRFLAEAAGITDNPGLAEASRAFLHIADQWARLSEWFKAVSEAPNAADRLPEARQPLADIAELEQAAWSDLQAAAEKEATAHLA